MIFLIILPVQLSLIAVVAVAAKNDSEGGVNIAVDTLERDVSKKRRLALSSGCDFYGMDLDYAVSSVLTQLPSSRVISPIDFAPAFHGIEFGPVQLKGFDKMTRYGPLLPFCIEGKRMVQVDLISTGDASLSFNWKACSRQEAQIELRNSPSRLTVHFRVLTHPVYRAYRLEVEDAVVPVTSAHPYAVLEGVGEDVRFAFTWLSKIFPTVTRAVWNKYFTAYFQPALREAASKLFGGGERLALYWEQLP